MSDKKNVLVYKRYWDEHNNFAEKWTGVWNKIDPDLNFIVVNSDTEALQKLAGFKQGHEHLDLVLIGNVDGEGKKVARAAENIGLPYLNAATFRMDDLQTPYGDSSVVALAANEAVALMQNAMNSTVATA